LGAKQAGLSDVIRFENLLIVDLLYLRCTAGEEQTDGPSYNYMRQLSVWLLLVNLFDYGLILTVRENWGTKQRLSAVDLLLTMQILG